MTNLSVEKRLAVKFAKRNRFFALRFSIPVRRQIQQIDRLPDQVMRAVRVKVNLPSGEV